MKKLIRNHIEKRLGGFRQLINTVEQNAPFNIKEAKKVAIAGGGLAGMTAATLLAERGFEVDVYERETYIGGKVGSWSHTFPDSFTTHISHGFHGFFKQYYNLRRILGRVGTDRNLTPIDDYYIMTQKYGDFSFKDVNPVPVLNLISMLKTKIYSVSDLTLRLKTNYLMAMMEYDRDNTFAAYDSMSFEEYADLANLPPKMRLMFTTFSRAFFADPELISMAELIKSFHFYFLSNDHGLLYDVLNDDFSITLWQPMIKYLENYAVTIHTNTPVEKIGHKDDKFVIGKEQYDYLILATDVPGTQKIIADSPQIRKANSSFAKKIEQQKVSQPYAVLRIWIDKTIERELPAYVFTDALEILDSITIVHRLEKSSREWVEKNGGGIFELHSYALPEGLTDHIEIKQKLLQEFEVYLPEVSGYKVRYDHLQVKEDFTSYHINTFVDRAETVTGISGFYLCGDWIKLPVPAMLMEAAVTSGIYAVNEILNAEKLQEEPIYSVPVQGLFRST